MPRGLGKAVITNRLTHCSILAHAELGRFKTSSK